MSERRVFRSRAHVHINKFISLSLPLDEVFEAVATVGRRVLVAVKHPRVGRNVKARVSEVDMERFDEEERDAILRDTEKTLTGLGYPKKQARAAIAQVRDDALGKKSHEVVAMALRAARPPDGTEIVESTRGKESGQTGDPE